MGHHIPQRQITREAVFRSRCFTFQEEAPKRPGAVKGAPNERGEANP